MKKIVVTIVLFAVLLSLPTARIFATNEAGAAAQIALGVPVSTGDTRAQRLRAFLSSYDSPLTNEADTFVREADKYNLDWKLVAAIAGVESTFGKQIPTGSYNGWGWGVFTGATDGIHFKNWADGIATVSQGIRENYLDRGAKDIYDMGWIYAANGNSWSAHVRFFIEKIESFQPATVDTLPVSI